MTETFSFNHALKSFFARRAGSYTLGILAVVLLAGMDVVPALIIKRMTDEVQGSSLSYSVPTYALMLFGCYISIALLRAGWRFFLIIPSRYLETELRQEAYGKLLSSRYSHVSKSKTGDVISTLVQDIPNMRLFMGPGLLIVFDSLAYITFIPLALFYLLGLKAFYVLAPFLALLIAVIKLNPHLEKNYSKQSDSLGDLSQHIFEEAQGVKFFRLEHLLFKRQQKYTHLLNLLFRTQIKITGLELVLESVLQQVIYGSYIVMLVLAFQEKSSLLLGIGYLTTTLQLLDKLTWPLLNVSYLMNLYQSAKSGAKRWNEIVSMPEKQNGQTKIDQKISSINMEGLQYSTPEGKILLKNISLKLSAGEKIGIVGKVSSGKSTLLKIMAGLMEPDELKFQEFSFNHFSYEKIDRQTLYQHLSFIPQSAQLFALPLRKNLAPHLPFHEESLLDSLEAADLGQDLQTFPDGLSTLIGEKGLSLSGGQKQRVAIARSFYAKSSLHLWDDTISALDTTTEKKIINNLHRFDPEAILVMCTHRLTSLRNFDRILILDEGVITAQGTYDELSENNPVFQALLNQSPQEDKGPRLWN